jgi:AcrR family transcriptional regulator
LADVAANRAGAPQGKYAPGIENIEQIIQAAVTVLVTEGYAGLTLRKIAERCNMKVGNLTYYFPTKQLLVEALLENSLTVYRDRSNEIYEQDTLSAEKRLEEILVFWLEDIQTKRTSRLFTELWAMANHDAFIAERLDAFYRSGQDRFGRLIAQINPGLPELERQVLAAYISGVMEGSTVFAGYQKPWASKMPWIAALAVRSVLDLVRTASAEEIRALAPSWRFTNAEGEFDAAD